MQITSNLILGTAALIEKNFNHPYTHYFCKSFHNRKFVCAVYLTLKRRHKNWEMRMRENEDTYVLKIQEGGH